MSPGTSTTSSPTHPFGDEAGLKNFTSALAKLVNNTLKVSTSSSLSSDKTTVGKSEVTTTSGSHSVSTSSPAGSSNITKQVIEAVNKTIQSLTSTTTTSVPHTDVTPTRGTATFATTTSNPPSSHSQLFPNNGSVGADTHSVHGFPGKPHDHQHMSFLAHSFLFQAVLILMFVVGLFAIIYILRKKHLDRLRHHLMPVYNFDPSDDGEDWETELLDDQMVHMPNNDPNPSLNGQLKLDTGLTRGLRVHNNNSASSSTSLPMTSSKMLPGMGSPTAASGLLSSSSDSHGSQGRRLYTHERDPIA